MYENGEITEEYYNSIVAIRSMDESDWSEIVKEYNSGKIDKEQYEVMKQIREMPDDWRTLGNGLKGLGYGVANGFWEGLQWYVGGKLGEATIEGHKIATSAMRVGVDTAFNAADSPYRAFIDAMASDRNFNESWEKQGGWQSFISNLAVGLIGSTGGEVFGGLKGVNSSKNSEINVEINNEIGETAILEKIKNKIKNIAHSETENVIDWKKFNTRDINFEEWNNARNAYMNFYEKNAETFRKYGIKPEHIIEGFNKVCMCSDAEYLNLVKAYYGKNTSVYAFNVDGYIFIPSDACAKDIAHEVTHSWGYLFIDNNGNFNRNYNSVSEAVTEATACSMGLDPKTTSSYTCNVDIVNKISEKLDSNGFKNAFLDAYMSRDSTKIKNIIDRIAGEGYYDELASKFTQNQQAFIEAYSTKNWDKYYKQKYEFEKFLDKLN